MATKSSVRKRRKTKSSNGLSPRTKKAIDTLRPMLNTSIQKYKSAQERSNSTQEPFKEGQRQAPGHGAVWPQGCVDCGEKSGIQEGMRYVGKI